MGCLLFACFSVFKNKQDKHLVEGTSSIDQVSFVLHFLGL